MADVYKRLYQGVLGTSATTLYTAPSSTQVIVRSIRVVNTNTASVTLRVWQGGTADTNLILPATAIDPGGFGEFEGVLTMEAGDTLAAAAGTASSLTFTVHGMEIT